MSRDRLRRLRRARLQEHVQSPGAAPTTEEEGRDDFPSQSWGTRALFEYGIPGRLRRDLGNQTVLEPCAGRGHMVLALRDYVSHVEYSDKFDYGTPGAGVRTSNFDSKDESHTQLRYKQPAIRIRLLRTPCSSPSFSIASAKCHHSPSRTVLIENPSIWAGCDIDDQFGDPLAAPDRAGIGDVGIGSVDKAVQIGFAMVAPVGE